MSPRWRAAALLLTIAAACSKDGGIDPVPTNTTYTSTWARIQGSILVPSCTSGCHTTGSSDANQSGLALEGSGAYNALVGIAAKNAAAKADGMLRVKASDPDASYFYWKLLYLTPPAGHDYGAPMPLGKQALTYGQIEYIRRWIAAGAPATGEVADTTVLANTTRFDVNAFTPLAPPSQGYQLRIEPFSVAPNFERELFIYKKVGNTTDVFVNRIETKMRLGSHHFLVYTMRPETPVFGIPTVNLVRDIRNPDGSMNFVNMLPMAWHIFFGGSMTPTSDYRFPDGVAMRIPANDALDLNAQYVNKTNIANIGEAYANLYTVSQASVQREAKALDMNNTDLTLPARTRTTVTKTFAVTQTTTIFLLTSHMHARGEKFVIKIYGGARNGEVVYENTDWEHPLMKPFTTPIVLTAGQGLTSEITYNNDTDRIIKFGLTSEDEMGIIFGYYY